jgi:hypothetical protein
VEITEKQCVTCGVTKPVPEFYANKQNQDGLGCYCKTCKREHDRRYRDKNRDRVRRQAREWRTANTDHANELRRGYERALRLQVVEAYGGKCACCGESHIQFLTLDHINGGGSAHRKSIHGKVYAELRRNGFPPGYQILCWNCNAASGLYGKCPHKTEVKCTA